jgi:hypothetical protein
MFLLFPIVTACDPAHNGYFENGTSEPITIEIQDYKYQIADGIKISPYPKMDRLELKDANISSNSLNGITYISVILKSGEGLLVSYSLGPRPFTERDIKYKILTTSDTIYIAEKDIFLSMKKRDRSRFKYFYTFQN